MSLSRSGLFWGVLLTWAAVCLPLSTVSGQGLSPKLELAGFELADPDLKIELVAAEPEVVSPVAMAWDAQLRLIVAEMRDYPNLQGGGCIRILDDRDKNGIYESSTLFAQGISFPNSVLPWRDGILVTAAPDLLFLRDTNGDGVADERKVLLSGFATGNQQLRANGLHWMPDGWVYGANGRSDGSIRVPGRSDEISLRGRDFRFRPDTGEFETLAGRSQFGLAFDAWGHRFLSWNTIPARHEVFEDRYLARNPSLADTQVLQDIMPPDDDGRVFPATPPPRVFNAESSAHFNALAGLSIYRGSALGNEYRNHLFVGETLLNLVHHRKLEATGSTFVARRVEHETEFLRSRDPWFHPVHFATGPDDCLYIADFYRSFVEHPDFVPAEVRSRTDWNRGHEHGRIWRIRHKNHRLPSMRRPPAEERPSQWIRQIVGGDFWARSTAQRLVWERNETSLSRQLEKALRSEKNSPEGHVAVLQTLASLSRLSPENIRKSATHPNPMIRAWSLRLGQSLPMASDRGPEWAALLQKTAFDSDARVRLQAVIALGSLPDETIREATLSKVMNTDNDSWVRKAAAGASQNPLPPGLVSSLWPPAAAASLRPPPIFPAANPDRESIVRQYHPALQKTGDPIRGAKHFSQLCLPCHSLQGQGHRMGPDLAGIGSKPSEVVLSDILDPNRQVAPEYAAYEFEMSDGDTVSGLFASESPTRITIRRPALPDENIPRSKIRNVRALGRSLMPDGMESSLTIEAIADLLSFLRAPLDTPLPALPRE